MKSVAQKRRANSLQRIGILVCILVVAAVIMSLVLGRAAAQGGSRRIILQQHNSRAIVDGEVQALTEGDGAVQSPQIVEGSTMLPVRWLAEAMGLSVGWDSAAESIVLTRAEEADFSVSLTMGQTGMQVNGETVALAAAPVSLDGVSYAPVRELAEACGWHVQYVDEAQGGLLFLDNHQGSAPPSEKEISEALQILGPSRSQMLADGLITRAGAGVILHNATREELRTADDRPIGVAERNGTVYLPIEGVTPLLDGTAEATADGYRLTTADGQSAEIRQAQEGAETASPLYVDEDGAAYVSAEALAKLYHWNLTYPAQGVVAMTRVALEGFADQAAYAAELAAALPDTKPDVPKGDYYVALTFDDGPTGRADGGLTARLLDGLAARGAHATFFQCGYRIKDFHGTMDRILTEGHESANHTMDHPGVLTKYEADKVYNQINDNSELIASYTGAKPTLFRPVGGAYNDMVLEQAKKAGLPVINWSLDTMDWKYRDAARVKDVLVGQVQDGDIVLMHDLYESTVDGVLAAMDELQAKGFAFVTVSELAQLKGVELEPGKIYTGFRAS